MNNRMEEEGTGTGAGAAVEEVRMELLRRTSDDAVVVKSMVSGVEKENATCLRQISFRIFRL